MRGIVALGLELLAEVVPSCMGSVPWQPTISPLFSHRFVVIAYIVVPVVNGQ